MGFLCEQLAVFRQEHADLRAEVSTVRDLLKEEEARRESGDSTLRQDVEGSLQQLLPGRGSPTKVKEGWYCKGGAAPHLGGATLREGGDLKEAFTAQSRAKQKLKQDLEKTRAVCFHEKLKAAMKPDSAELSTLTNTSLGQSVASAPSRANDEVGSSLQDVRGCLQSEVIKRSAEIAELTQQLRETMDSMQEEKTQRISEDAELKIGMEILRQSIDDAWRHQNEASLQANQPATDLSKRFNDEMHALGMRTSTLEQLSSVESESTKRLEESISTMYADQKAHAQAFVEVSGTLAQLRSQLQGPQPPETASSMCGVQELIEIERTVRATEIQLLSSRIDEFAKFVDRAEIEMFLSHMRNDIVEEQKARAALHSEVQRRLFLEVNARGEAVLKLTGSAKETSNSLSEVQRRLDLEVKAREETDRTLLESSHNLSKCFSEVQSNLDLEVKSREGTDLKVTEFAQTTSASLSLVESRLDLEVQAREEADLKLAESVRRAGQALEESLEEALQRHLSQSERAENSSEMQRLSGRIDECMRLSQKVDGSESVLAQLREDMNAEQKGRADLLGEVERIVRTFSARLDEQETLEAAQVSRRTEGFESSLADGKELAAEVKRLSSRLDICMCLAQSAEDSAHVLEQLRADVTSERKSSKDCLDQVRIGLQCEAEAREAADLKLSQCVQQVCKDLEEAELRQEAMDKQVQESKVAPLELEILRQGLTKVVEVFRQEHAKLREECCSAMHSSRSRGSAMPSAGSPQPIRRV